jgi:hypothetical protein
VSDDTPETERIGRDGKSYPVAQKPKQHRGTPFPDEDNVRPEHIIDAIPSGSKRPKKIAGGAGR